jgi:hypothetical protein
LEDFGRDWFCVTAMTTWHLEEAKTVPQDPRCCRVVTTVTAAPATLLFPVTAITWRPCPSSSTPRVKSVATWWYASPFEDFALPDVGVSICGWRRLMSVVSALVSASTYSARGGVH